MSIEPFLSHYRSILDGIRAAGLWKEENQILTAQGPTVAVRGPGGAARPVLNFCANNYLGLAGDRRIIAAAKAAMDTHGFGLASVRFICGTQDLHKTLEDRISKFLGTEDTILYSSCFDANGGLFETLLGEDDAVITDASTTPASSTGSACRRRSGASSPTATWKTSSGASRSTPATGCASSPPTGSSACTATRRSCPRSAPSPSATRRWSWSTTPTPPACGGRRPGHAGEDGRRPADRRDDEHLREGHGRRDGRVHDGPEGADRPPAPAVPAVPLLELRGAADRRAAIAAIDILETEPWRLESLSRNAARFRGEMAARGFGSPPETTRSCRS